MKAPSSAVESATQDVVRVVQSGGVKIAPLYGIGEKDQVKKITGMKKAMTKTMTESLSIPFFTFSDDMNATELIKLRK